MTDELQHIGVARRSGRYKWGSGKDPQRNPDVLSKIDALKLDGISSEKDIAEALGMNTTELRNAISWASKERKEILMDQMVSLRKKGKSHQAIGDELGASARTVGNYLKESDKVKVSQLDNTVNVLKNGVNEHGYLDVGIGVERQMGISRDKMKAAISKLEEEGYVRHEIYIKRLNDPSKYTTIKVLTKETDLEVVKANSDKIRPVESWTDDGGLTYLGLGPIQMVNWERVGIVYGDEGGTDKDGVMELRRNVKDLDLGTSNYAQVRIGVGDTHYLKGMAMYGDDFPDGVDIMFYTNKPKGTPREKVLKGLKDNEDNRFGATIKPFGQRGALNIVNEEGDWNTWSSTLSAQFLSKQPTKLVKERLDATHKKLTIDLDEINSLTNPIVRKHLLEAYGDGLDSKARHLKAQGLAKSKTHVLLPFPDMNPNEVYAPKYNDGDRLVLVRYPHGGRFELPELTVNNKGPAKRKLGNALDAIGIHPSVAQKLSGADFDGDTAFVIPNNQRKVKTARSLKELKDFDPVAEYKVNYKTITPKAKQTQMGVVSNLITDMTIKGATQGELARAVRHSMVVIDSEKHDLDYKKSARDNGITALQKRYQTHVSPTTGKQSRAASTIVSRSKKQDRKTKKYLVDEIYERDGSVDALSSGTAVEGLYSNYMNKVKAMSNTVKKEIASIPPIKYDREASKKYEPEVKSLNAKLNTALLNAPRERQAQLMATTTYYKNLDYDMDKDQKKKLKSQAIATARDKVGADRKMIEITPKEWEAIQNNAVSNDKLNKILKNTDMDKVKALATPRTQVKMSTAKQTRAMAMAGNGYTHAEIADALGVSVSSIQDALSSD